MMRRRQGLRSTFAALAWAFMTALPASAGEPVAARAAFANGDFLGAARAAERADTPEGQVLAARALLAHCLFGAQAGSAARDATIDRAIRNAQAALNADPGSVEARLQLAMALGLKGRRSSVVEAFTGRYAPRGRKLIDEAISLNPSDPFAYALLGAWHLEVLRRGGRSGARIYGARLSAGLAAFDRARALAPDDPTIALIYAAGLLELNPEAHAAKAAALLTDAQTGTAADALDRGAKEEAARLAAALQSKGPKAAAAIAAARMS